MVGGKLKKSLFFKTVNLVLVFAFSFCNVNIAEARKIVSAPAVADIELSVPAVRVEDIGVAIDAGSVKSKYSGSSGKVIIHIQDAHCNFEAQSNINKILGQLTKENGIDMISVEGAEGLVDTAWFRAFPDAEIRKEVATYFMKKGEITGAEFFSINSDYEGNIFGAETRDYYVKNLKAFTEVYPYKDQIEKYLTNTQAITSRLKSIVYHPALKAVDSKIKSFKDKETELSDYAEYLQKTALKNKVDITSCENFGKLLQTLEYEGKIDFDIVDQERTTYIDLLSKKLPKKEMTELVAQSIKFKKGHIEAVHFYSYLRDLARVHSLAMVQEYPNLFYYYIYTKLYDGINNENLFREIAKIETSLKEKLFKDDTQRDLDKYASMLDMYAALVNIELTNEDYDKFKAYSTEFTMEDVLAFIRRLSGRYNLNYSIGPLPLEVKERLPNMVDFYEIAMKRDNALIDNTLHKMKEDGKDRCVLIAGGFHTRGIKNILEKKGISYVVVTPKITKDVETPYIKVLTNQRTSLEDIITESAAMPAAGHSIINEKPSLAAEKLLSQVPRIFSAQKLFDGGGAEEIEKLSEDIGTATGQGEDTLAKKLEEIIDSIQAKSIKIWIKEKDAKEGSTKLADEYLKDLWTFLEGCLPKKPEKADGMSDSEYETLLKSWQKTAIKIEKANLVVYAKVKPIIEEKFGVKETPGETPGGADILDYKKAREIDEVYRFFFKERAIAFLENGDGLKGIRQGLRFVLYEHNLLETLIKKGLSTDIRPGRGGEELKHTALQVHIDGRVFRALRDVGEKEGENFIKTVAQHELAHLDIFNADEIAATMAGEDERKIKTKIKEALGKDALKTWERWNEYVKTIEKEYGRILTRDEKMWQQEYFANFVLGHDVTGRIAEIINGVVAEKILLLTEETLREDNPAPEVLQKTVEKAYIFATEHGHASLYVEILNLFQEEISRDSRKEQLIKRAFVNAAKRYPLLVRKDLMEKVNPRTAGLLNKWYEKSELSNDINTEDVKAVILAGGGGERMFPLSTKVDPKQTIKMLEESLLVMAVQRLINNLGANNVYIQTTLHLRKKIYQDLKYLGIREENIFAEPTSADTAAAIGYAAARLERQGYGNDVMFIGTADHFIDMTTSNFQDTYMNTAKVAKNSPSIGTIGIDPEPIGVSIDYGCIEKGPKTFFMNEKAIGVRQFREKPDAKTSAKLFDENYVDGSHAWLYNSGMYVGRPEIFLEAYKNAAPFYYERFLRMVKAKDDGEMNKTAKEIFTEFAKCKANKKFPHHMEQTGSRSGVSIDYVLSQPISRGEVPEVGLFMIPGEFNWMDIGSYLALYNYGKDIEGIDDQQGNVIYNPNPENNVILKNCSNCLIHAKDVNVKLKLEGLKNVVVAYNPRIKAVMIAPLDTETGKSIKSKLIPYLESKKGLYGYFYGDPQKIIPSDKRATVYSSEEENDMYAIDEGDSIILGSQNCVASSALGLGIILDMQNVELGIFSQHENKDIPEIVITQVSQRDSTAYDTVEKVHTIYNEKLPLTSAERVNNTIKMIERGDVSEEELIPTFYQDMYVISSDEAKHEVKTIKEKLERYAYCEKTFKKPKMGTSGIRANANELTDQQIGIITKGINNYLMDLPNRTDLPADLSDFIKKGAIKKGDYMVVAGDLRPSTERIMLATAIGILESGNKVDYIGKVATPVAALYGLLNKMAVAVVTGSHIPITDNGEKFYRANGELWKEEEGIFFQYIEEAYREEYLKTWKESKYNGEGMLKSDEELILSGQVIRVMEAREAIRKENANKRAKEAGKKTALQLYEERLLKAFGRSLGGIELAFWEQTTVDRDDSPRRLKDMGADIVTVGRMNEAEDFLTLDTEDVKEKYRKMAENFMNQTDRDVLITKDGDGDRPAVFIRLKNGEVVFIPGDKLNILAALLLKPKQFSIPRTANYTALEALEDAGTIIDYNNVGSPHIDLSMMEYLGFDTNGKTGSYGCEVNGGGFIGDKEFSLPEDVVDKLIEFNSESRIPFKELTGKLSRLSTRDAAMPVVAALLLAKIKGKTLPELYEETFSGKYQSETGAVLVENVSKTKCTPGCEKYTKEIGKAIVDSFSPSDATIEEVNIDDDLGITVKHVGSGDFIKAKNAEEIRTISRRLEKYYKQISGLRNERIVQMVFKDKRGKPVGIHSILSNGERVILRPSNNAAQLRGYTLAKTLKRIKEMNSELERPNTGILVKVIQDFANGPIQTEGKTFISDESPFTVGMYAATETTLAKRDKGDLGVLLGAVMPTALALIDDKISPEDAVKKVDSFMANIKSSKDDVIAFTRVVMRDVNVEKIYGAKPKELVIALRLMQIAALAGNSKPTKPYFTRYEWTGEGNQVQYDLSAPGKNEFNVAEAWNNMTIKSKRNPDADSVIPGTAIIGKDGMVIAPEVTLRELVNIAPEVFLGKGHKRKPFFEKSLSTRFADKVHEGFNEKILEVGKETYTNWLIQERKNVEKLLASLRENLTKVEFDEYRAFYEEWVEEQADTAWRLQFGDSETMVDLIPKIQHYLRSNVSAGALLHEIKGTRANIVKVLNEIKLKDGMIVLSPTGRMHGIFGLSHQTHPMKAQRNKEGKMEYPKNEAWIVKDVTDAEGRKTGHKILIEPQQTSDTTFSVADFFTPIVWDNKKNAPKMRKDSTPENIRYYVKTGLKFEVTNPEDVVLKPKDITPTEGAHNAKLESLINETSSVWPTKYFVAEKIILDGKGRADEASIAMNRIEGHAHDLLVLEGTVAIMIDGQEPIVLTQGMSVPMDAEIGNYVVKSQEKAEVLRVYPEEESYVEAETQAEDKITGKNFVEYTPEDEQPVEVPVRVEKPLEDTTSHKTQGIVTDVVLDKGGMSQEIELVGLNEEVEMPQIIGERSHFLHAAMGDFSLLVDGKELTDVKEGTTLTISKEKIIDSYGRVFPVSKDTAVEYKLVRKSLGHVKVGVRYDNTAEEKDVCSAWKALTEERSAIAKEKYAFIAPRAMYVDGEGPGSRKWEKDTLNDYLHSKDCFNINMYNSKFGLTSSSVRRIITNAVRRGRIPLLVATQKLFDDASKDESFRNFLKEKKVRIVPPIPSLDKLDKHGWFFTREVEGQALLQGLLTVESIKAKDAFAQKVRKVVSQSLRRSIDINELYYLVGFGDDMIPAEYRPKSTLEWMVYMINTMLQRMDVKPFNAYKDLEKQRRTMYSV